MTYINEIPVFIEDASLRVLKRRAAVLRELVSMLARYSVPFTYDEELFMSNRPYAACTFQAQSKMMKLLDRFSRLELDLDTLRASGVAIAGRPSVTSMLMVDLVQFDALLAGVTFESDEVQNPVLQWLQHTNFLKYVECGVGLALLGKKVTQNNCVKNHSDEFHLFTVNLDIVVDNPVKMAEALVHEASHNLLNVFLEDKQITLRDQPLEWFSPWTNSLRHHRGIVHGFFAFTLVVVFYQRLEVAGFTCEIDRYTDLQKGNLCQTYSSLQRILDEYPSSLRQFIEDAYACVK